MRRFIAALLSATMFSGAALAASETFPVTFSAPAGVANTMTVSDASGAGETNYPLQFGRPFVEGAIPDTPAVLVNGALVASQADVKERYPDGSVKWAVMAVVVPAIPADGSVTLSFADNATPDNTPLTVAQMQGAPYNFDAHINLTIPPRIAGKPTASNTCAAWSSITNGEFQVNGVTVGPINFTNAPCSWGNPSAFPVIAADVNAALAAAGVKAFVTQSLNISNGARYFQITGTAGLASLTYLTSPGAGTDISGMLNLTSGNSVDANLNASAPSVSANAMLTAAGACTPYSSAPALCKLWTSGPVAQTILLGDDSAAAAYDVGNGDGAKPFRPRFEATFWPALGQVYVRAIGENDNIAELEDFDAGVQITLGASSPATLYQADLSGTGEMYNEGITGLTSNGTSGYEAQNTLAVAGTPSAPLTVGQHYNALDTKTDEWVGFTYLSPTSIQLVARGEMAGGGFGTSSDEISVGDPLVVTDPTVMWMESAWTREGWIGTAPNQEVNIDPNLAYLDSTEFIPNYDPSLAVPAATVTAQANTLWGQYPNNFYDSGWDNGSEIQSYMENAGARPDIGPEPEWVALFLESHGNYQMSQTMYGLADLYSEEPFNLRESVAGKRLLRSDTPGASTGLGHFASITDRTSWDAGYYNGTAQDNPVIAGVIDNDVPITTSGTSHLPDPYYVPYLLSGDPYYLSRMYAWNAWMSAYIEPGTRAAPTGDYGSLFFHSTSGERSIAWGIRSRAEVAFIAPDVDAEKTYFTYQMNDAIATLEGGLGITGDANFDTTAPYAAQAANGDYQVDAGPNTGKAPPLGNMGNQGINPVGSVLNSAAGWNTSGNTVGSFDSQFMTYYLEDALGYAQQLGFQDGPVVAHVGAWEVGLINSAYPWEMQEEFIPTEPTMPTGGPYVGFLATWADTWAMFQSGWLAPGGGQETAFNGALSNPESYPAYAAAGASYLTGLSGGSTAWSWVNTNIHADLPYASVGDPTWDILPATGTPLPAIGTSIPASTDPL